MSIQKFTKGFSYAGQGIAAAARSELNFRVHLVFAVLAGMMGIWLNISLVEWCIVSIAIGWVLMAELFNTAIEALSSHVSPGMHPTAKLVKDVSAGAVLVSAISALVVGLLIFGPKLYRILLMPS